MPTGHLAKAPDLLVICAKKIADCVESYKASRYAGHYLITHEAIKDARNLLVDVEDLKRWLRLFEQNFRVVKWAPAGVRHSAGQLKLTSAVRGYAATQRGSES